MYLTCASVNRLDASARQALADCCDMHRNVMKLFSFGEETPPRQTQHVLYRMVEQGNDIKLYISSAAAPDLSRAKWLYHGQNARQRPLDALLTAFHVGRQMGFDLLACPSKKVASEGRPNSARVFLRTPQERRDWLNRQGEKYGFAVCALREYEPVELYGKRKTGNMSLRAVRFSGLLKITDAERFAEAYRQGIGPEKAYGLGMLLLTGG